VAPSWPATLAATPDPVAPSWPATLAAAPAVRPVTPAPAEVARAIAADPTPAPDGGGPDGTPDEDRAPAPASSPGTALAGFRSRAIPRAALPANPTPARGADAEPTLAPVPPAAGRSGPLAGFRPVDAAPDPAPSAAPAGGTVGCPACGQPIAKGARRCSSCGARLLLGVPARRASTLVGSGLFAGVLVGGLLFGALLPRDATSASGSNLGPAASGPTLTPVSPNAAAALRGTTALNGRLADEADPLAAMLRETSFPSQDAVKAFRRMSIDVRSASAMVAALGDWPEAATHQSELADFYEQLTSEINDGLAASATSAESYRTATTTILSTLRKIVQLDASARTLAASAGIELQPVAIPAALR